MSPHDLSALLADQLSQSQPAQSREQRQGAIARIELHGDAAATAAASRFAHVTVDERGEHGRVVKGLGDGAMLVFSDAAEAVAAWRRFRASMADPGDPALHGGVHQGVVVRREGDYFGAAVNLAARLMALAGRDELLATRAAVESAGAEETWVPLGSRRLRGLREEVEIFRLEAGPSTSPGAGS